MNNNILTAIKSYYLPSPKIISECLYKDKEIVNKFHICIKNIKYKPNTLKYRLKLEATKGIFIDDFINKLIKKIDIIIKIKNKCIIDYFNQFKTKYNYDDIIKELDELLEQNKPIINKCNCANEGFGFCFCI